jgi:RNA polymerase sigma-70 factor (ECF subfamily)
MDCAPRRRRLSPPNGRCPRCASLCSQRRRGLAASAYEPRAASSAGERRAEDLRRILTRAVARVCPPDLASQKDDLVQSAVLRVLEIESRREADVSFAASYLWRVAFTVVVDEMRRRRRSALLAATPDDEQAREEGQAVPPRPDLARAIEDCLQRLAEARRLAVLLWLQGFQAPDAMRILRWPVKRVRNATFRGIQDLRSCLQGKGVRP